MPLMTLVATRATSTSGRSPVNAARRLMILSKCTGSCVPSRFTTYMLPDGQRQMWGGRTAAGASWSCAHRTYRQTLDLRESAASSIFPEDSSRPHILCLPMQHGEMLASAASSPTLGLLAWDHQVWCAPADASGDADGAVAIVDGMCVTRPAPRAAPRAARRLRAPKKSLCCAFPGCGYAFVVAAELARHVAVAHGLRKTTCPVEGCGQRFAHVGFLRAHVKCKHPGFQEPPVAFVRFATTKRTRTVVQ